jgi:hypothetical protein
MKSRNLKNSSDFLSIDAFRRSFNGTSTGKNHYIPLGGWRNTNFATRESDGWHDGARSFARTS